MLRSYLPLPPVRWQWLEIAGPDAQDYLHRLTTVDVKGLEPGRGAPGCLLTAQGKMRGWFWLWQISGDRYGFELDAGQDGKWAATLKETIEQFHFAEKFALTEPPHATSQWLFPESMADLPVALEAGRMAMAGEVPLLHHGARDFGRDWLTAWGPSAKPSPNEVSFAELESWRIGAVRPRVGAEVDENAIPLEVGLVDALAMNKGCYPGQEVIERTISLGSPARRLARIELDAKPGEPILLAGAGRETGPEIGRITSSVPGHALALVRKMHAKEGTEVVAGTARGRITALAPFK